MCKSSFIDGLYSDDSLLTFEIGQFSLVHFFVFSSSQCFILMVLRLRVRSTVFKNIITHVLVLSAVSVAVAIFSNIKASNTAMVMILCFAPKKDITLHKIVFLNQPFTSLHNFP